MIMPKYMVVGSYTKEAWASMVETPEDRSVAARKLCENVGGKLDSFYWAFGPDDWVAIADLPNDEAAGAISLATTSAGVSTGVRTIKLITMDQAQQMLRKTKEAAAGYVKPGAARAGARG
jgi:uncharacterized protein with GYD domain